MISHEDSRLVICAFNSNHRMSVQRYNWHLARCPDKKKRESEGLPIFVCKYHRMHIFLNRAAYHDHMAICDSKTVVNSSQQVTDLKPREPVVEAKEEVKEIPFGAVVEE